MKKTEEKLKEISQEHISALAGSITEKDLTKVTEKAEEIQAKSKGVLGPFFEDIKLLLGIVKDFRNGTYRKIPKFSVCAIAVTLLYVLSPIDLIPDFIPGLGMIDDAAVVMLCLKMVEKDLHKYKKWRASQI